MRTLPVRFKGVTYRRFSDPFSLDDLYPEILDAVHDQRDSNGYYPPLIADFSEVDLSRITAAEIRSFLTKIRNNDRIPNSYSNNYATCIAGDLVSFGALRMYGVYSEIYGVRDEDNFHVSESMLDSTRWLMQKMGHPLEEAVEVAKYFGKAA